MHALTVLNLVDLNRLILNCLLGFARFSSGNGFMVVINMPALK